VRFHHNQRPFEGLKPAPRKYWAMFERSKIPLSDEGLVAPPEAA
jgi:hypothetical protein